MGKNWFAYIYFRGYDRCTRGRKSRDNVPLPLTPASSVSALAPDSAGVHPPPDPLHPLLPPLQLQESLPG